MVDAPAALIAPDWVMRIESEALRRQVAEWPEVAFAMMASMSRHLKVPVDQVETMTLLSANQRGSLSPMRQYGRTTRYG